MKNLRNISRSFVLRVLVLKALALCTITPVAQPTLSKEKVKKYACKHLEDCYVDYIPNLISNKSHFLKHLNDITKKIEDVDIYDQNETRQDVKDSIDEAVDILEKWLKENGNMEITDLNGINDLKEIISIIDESKQEKKNGKRNKKKDKKEKKNSKENKWKKRWKKRCKEETAIAMRILKAFGSKHATA